MFIHVPGHLMDSLVALIGVGYSIKQKNKAMKRSVKFDEQNQDLYLDICIDGKWRRISPNEAKQALKDVTTANTASGASISIEELKALSRGRGMNLRGRKLNLKTPMLSNVHQLARRRGGRGLPSPSTIRSD